MKKVIFVCTGNICRSQMAQSMFADFVKKHQPAAKVVVDSAGISSEERGNGMDFRAQKVLNKHHVKIVPHQAKKITKSDVENSDLVVVMTYHHYQFLEYSVPPEKLFMFNQFVTDEGVAGTALDIRDPWYGGEREFEQTYEELKRGMGSIYEYLLQL
jgi:protein-tyrosine phosphatase